MKITNIQEFSEILAEDQVLNQSLRSEFASNYDCAADNNINTANEVAADHTYEALVSDAFTEGIEFDIDKTVLTEFLINQYGFAIAFVQSGF